MKRLKYLVKSYFGFSRTETNGFFVLMILIGLVLIAPFFSDYFFKNKTEETAASLALLDSLTIILNEQSSGNKISKEPIYPQHHKEVLFKFDPNETSLENFQKLGISKSIAQRIVNYRESGGKFLVKKDLLKIFGFKEASYQALYEFIDLPEIQPAKNVTTKTKEQKFAKGTKILSIDINHADTSDLIKIKGIGKVFSSRIVRYRDLLGGFVSKEQYAEIYGLMPEVIEKLKMSTYISSDYIPKKINLNTESLQGIAKHPYIDRSLAKAIYSYREQHGNFTGIDDLLNIKILSSDDLTKIKPYIAF